MTGWSPEFFYAVKNPKTTNPTFVSSLAALLHYQRERLRERGTAERLIAARARENEFEQEEKEARVLSIKRRKKGESGCSPKAMVVGKEGRSGG